MASYPPKQDSLPDSGPIGGAAEKAPLHGLPPVKEQGTQRGVNRREFLQYSGLIPGAMMSSEAVNANAVASAAAAPSNFPSLAVSLKVNGKAHQLNLAARTTLLDALRDHAALTGTKKGCDRGQCGACTVLINGRRINACLTLAVMHEGDDIVTIEGLGQPDNLHAMQTAFLVEDGFQCGFCTPGQICSAVSLLAELKRNEVSAATADVRAATLTISDDELRERMSGNICRCGAYPNIVKAVRSVIGGTAS